MAHPIFGWLAAATGRERIEPATWPMPFEPAQAPPPASDVALRRLCGGSNAGDVNLLSRSSNVRQAEHRAVRLATRRGSTGLAVATLGSGWLPARGRGGMRGFFDG